MKMNNDKLNNIGININNYPFECTEIDSLFCPKSNLSKTNKIDYFTPPGFSLDNSSIICSIKNK